MRVIAAMGTPLYAAFGVEHGVTAFVGGGGKTTSMLRLARELCALGRVLVTTSTHIFPPEGMRLLTRPSVTDIAAALDCDNPVCVGVPEKSGKLAAPDIPIATLAGLADYVLVEADGAKGRPLKAPAAHEPVLPACAALVIAVAGLDGIGKTIEQTAFRPELYAQLLRCEPSHSVTPMDVATVLASAAGQYKNVCAPTRFAVLLNKADDANRVRLAYRVAAYLPTSRVERVVITSCRETRVC